MSDKKMLMSTAYVFLEVNPAGQFMYIESATGLPIAAALAQEQQQPFYHSSRAARERWLLRKEVFDCEHRRVCTRKPHRWLFRAMHQ
jgi:hypothetical protein